MISDVFILWSLCISSFIIRIKTPTKRNANNRPKLILLRLESFLPSLIILFNLGFELKYPVFSTNAWKCLRQKSKKSLHGLAYFPKNRMLPEWFSWIANRNGRSHLKSTGGLGFKSTEEVTIKTAVAAAASVPSSFTSTKALWTTFEINSPVEFSLIPLKLALFGSKASVAPSAITGSESWNWRKQSMKLKKWWSFQITYCTSWEYTNLNLGM